MDILTIQNNLESLHEHSSSILYNDYYHSLFLEMKTYLRSKNKEDKFNGLGLALPQIGIMKRGFVFKKGDSYEIVINPIIIATIRNKGKRFCIEGCLSIPDEMYRVERWKEVLVKYEGLDGQFRIYTLIGLSAEIFQHEFDHLNGILICDIGFKIKQEKVI